MRGSASVPLVAEAQPEALRHHLHPVAKEIDQHGHQRAEMQRDVERQDSGLPAEAATARGKMRGAADGQEFGQP